MKDNAIIALKNSGIFSDIDLHFAGFIGRFSADDEPAVCLAAALVSRATANGDICLNLASLAETNVLERSSASGRMMCPPLDPWRERLLASPAVGRPGDMRPLILDRANRLYLYRYWEYENELAQSIRQRAAGELQDFNSRELMQHLNALFPPRESAGTDWQKVAAAVAALKRFSVITGGPGSGKTFTIARILALLWQSIKMDKPRVYLAAPTGKAAARLGESMLAAKRILNCSDDIKSAIPHEAYTIHRLLKPLAGTPYFQKNAANPLTAQVVVVDEASMVDLALMSKLVRAVPPNARLVLVGDQDQLASVEAGSVLGDICNRQAIVGFSNNFRAKIEQLTESKLPDPEQASQISSGMQDCITILQESYRFTAQGGIGGLSRAVNRGDSKAALVQLTGSTEKSVAWRPVSSDDHLVHDISRIIVEGYRKYLTLTSPVLAMKEFVRFQILCALKIGPSGANAINRLAEEVLNREGLISCSLRQTASWYRGRPVMITKNDYNLGLFNGDIGITLPVPESAGGALAVFFPDAAGDVKQVPTHRLADCETVFAMTVHKSQGSEFDHVILLLPERDYPLLTRELIYTAVTRARRDVSIWGSESVLKAAIARKIERTSGLRDALWDEQVLDSGS
jgi:exodeoxyribonuclease V alpha subunit